jgi:serine/threonine-protein kinase
VPPEAGIPPGGDAPASAEATKKASAFAAHDLIGGKYRLLAPLGEGGMGVLWVAHNELLDIDVAIKVIRPDMLGDQGGGAVQRLLQEARAAAKLGHPAIVRITDYGETPNGEPYLVMELLEGESLAAAIQRRGRMGPINAVRLLLPIAHALAAAHDKGIVHRDVKPENIFLARTDDVSLQPKLIDFGVAKLAFTEREKRITGVGSVVGSPAYIAPEVAMGEDARESVDVWALAVVLYELVTGELPFDGANYHAMLRAITDDTPVPITEHGAGDAALWAIVERGLQKKPRRRWPSARAFGQALAEWLLDRDIGDDICGGSLETIWMRRSIVSELQDGAPLQSTRTTGARRSPAASATSPGPSAQPSWRDRLISSTPPSGPGLEPRPSSRSDGDSQPTVVRVTSSGARAKAERAPSDPAPASQPDIRGGRCELFAKVASGGMATVHLGRMLGAGSFAKTVAVKRLHPQYAKDSEFGAMLLEEARVVARLHHPNVVTTFDVTEQNGELWVIMQLVDGVTLADLLAEAKRRDEPAPIGVVLRIVAGVLRGLHSAHELRDEQGNALQLVHRDVAPDNVLVGADGHARVLDFGVARALGRAARSESGKVTGKVAYMAPEQMVAADVERAADIFSAGVVLWEALTGERLFAAPTLGETMHRVQNHDPQPPSALRPDVAAAIDEVALRALRRAPAERWPTAAAMASALEAAAPFASDEAVGAWVESHGTEKLASLRAQVSEVERTPLGAAPPPPSSISTPVAGIASAPPPPKTRPLRDYIVMAAVALGGVLVGTLAPLGWSDGPRQQPTPPTVAAPAPKPSAAPAPKPSAAPAASPSAAESATPTPSASPSVSASASASTRRPKGIRAPVPTASASSKASKVFGF